MWVLEITIKIILLIMVVTQLILIAVIPLPPPLQGWIFVFTVLQIIFLLWIIEIEVRRRWQTPPTPPAQTLPPDIAPVR